MKQKIQNFFYILELALPDKLCCLSIGIYLGIFSIFIDEYWDIDRIPIYIMGIFIIPIIGLIGINFFDLYTILYTNKKKG